MVLAQDSLTHSVVETPTDRLLVAEARIPELERILGYSVNTLHTCKGADFVGWKYSHPIKEYIGPITHGKFLPQFARYVVPFRTFIPFLYPLPNTFFMLYP